MPMAPFVGALIVGSCAVCWRMASQESQRLMEEVALVVACAACGAGAINETGRHIGNARQLHQAKQQQAPNQQQGNIKAPSKTSPAQNAVAGRGGRRAGFITFVSLSGEETSVISRRHPKVTQKSLSPVKVQEQILGDDDYFV